MISPATLQRVRGNLRLSCREFAELLGLMGDRGPDHLREMEHGKRQISGPIALLVVALDTDTIGIDDLRFLNEFLLH